MKQITEIATTPYLWSLRRSWVNYPSGFFLTLDNSMLFLLEERQVTFVGHIPESYFKNTNQSEMQFQ